MTDSPKPVKKYFFFLCLQNIAHWAILLFVKKKPDKRKLTTFKPSEKTRRVFETVRARGCPIGFWINRKLEEADPNTP